jgi:hypothetical protein
MLSVGGLELNGLPRLMVYADYFNLLVKYHNKNTCSIVCSKEIGREVNGDKNICLIMSYHQNLGRNHKSFETV